MDMKLFYYSLSNKYFYEDILYKKNTLEFYEIVNEIISPDFELKKNSIFYSCMNNTIQLPSQGWKIHVSSNLKDAKEILKIVTKVCMENHTTFKFLRDMNFLKLTSEKIFPRGSSGKFITIYPTNEFNFIKIINILYDKLKNYEGPYILSDNRYKNCKVLYYRYGGILGTFLIDKDGERVPYIYDINNSIVEDKRNPYFEIPINITDPLANSFIQDNSNESYFNTKYELKEAIYFSNSGGIYKALDKATNTEVIIKESRPYTCMYDEKVDSHILRKSEYECLKKIENYNVSPKPIELFYDWEHIFLVEELIDGIDLYKYCAQNNPFYKTFNSKIDINTYIKDILKIFLNISKAVKVFHDNGLILVDLSNNNILIDKNLNVKLIDLEGCLSRDTKEFRQISQKAFSEKLTKNNLIESDLYSLGCVFLSCLIEKNEMLSLDKSSARRFLDSLFADYTLPIEIKEIILNLIESKPSDRMSLDKVELTLNNIINKSEIDVRKIHKSNNIQNLNIKFEKTIKDVLQSVLDSSNLNKMDRLFPNTPLVDNLLNISNGALGNLYALVKLDSNINIHNYINWVNNKLTKLDAYPPGLYVGLSGMAWSLLEIGELSSAKYVLDKCKDNKLFNNNYGIRTGLSGYGLTLIKFWLVTQNIDYLNTAIEIGEFLISKCNYTNENYAYWTDIDSIKVGYGDGSSGIALFLLYLYKTTQDRKYLDIGEMALKHDLSFKIYGDGGVVQFSEFTTNSNIVYPYFMKGNAGILSVLLRYYKVTKNKEYLNEIDELVMGTYIKYTFNPGLFLGVSGLGNTLLDCYQILKDEKYLHMAYDLAEGAELFKVNLENCSMFVGDYISKLSTDFGSGSLGILLFLKRLINQSDNFCFYLDELL